ncbi:MAG TPA: hypothetical protein VFA70_09380 [Dehalococcoidia bacterium]|jgi:hypothetical protein|nr:hypothetical protein [Dehalococcoidia bacterium]
MAGDTNKTTVLVLRDAAGSIYVVPEDVIRTCKATPEQQQALKQIAGTEDVVGYAAGVGGFSPVGSINVSPQIATTVAPQTNLNFGFNLVAGIGNTAQQGVNNSAVNGFLGLTNQRA